MDALIGHTGLVGGTVARARAFDAAFRSTDIDAMRGRTFELVVCAGARAEKWKANLDPEGDRAGVARLTDVLETVRIGHLVLVSSIDVYPAPVGVDEHTPIDADILHAYGRHRYALEQFCQHRFETTVVRLPGLFGHGLKKNAVFDLLYDNAVDKIHPDSVYQFYDLERLWRDIERVRESGIALVNVAVEPVRMGDVAKRVFGRVLTPPDGVRAARYDMRSLYAGRFGGREGYWYDAASTFSAMERFVSNERRAGVEGA
jgi:nucleoside-diphosphate-sugar epimerase